MNIFSWLFGRSKSKRAARFDGSEAEQIEATKAAIQSVAQGNGPAAGRFPKLADGAPEVLTQTPNSAVVAKEGPTPTVNIWEMEEEPVPAAPVPTPAREIAADAGARRRATRTKTRVLGFEPQPAAVVPLFDEGRMDDSIEPGDKAGVVMYPTGWLVIVSGPGRGAAFPVMRGISQIGRGADQTISLDFGDMAISRQNHAAIAYDPTTHQFHLGHGGKSNLVRLNGKPLLTTSMVGDRDVIQIGETTLMLKVLCTPDFNWSAVESEGDGNDMAIA
ncbi:FHA domain-containing protein [Tabrizicola sp.]|uniref:FHA domain-containing protein n=1 Tax=Tabrizicola sp. TaxID=2005166 RepID=UPI0027341FCB|nr:FHA domain-containing protein [Tabrizicola sp.]MDP3197513.1 FHA domain-containing protein [Tabrizicola sp.]